MKLQTTTLLFAVCIGASVFDSTSTNEVRHEAEYQLLRHKRFAYKGQYGAASGTTMKYRFASGFNESLKSVFVEATQLWSDGTCLHFKEGDESATDGILVMETDKPACYTDSNRTVHNISLGQFCTAVAGIAHEIGHALGLPHAQIRPDRDSYVDISNEGIKKEFDDYDSYQDPEDPNKVTFEQYKEQYAVMKKEDTVNYSVPYDLGSIMQYSYSPGMMPKDMKYNSTMGSPFVSFVDKLLINRHYNCSGMLTRRATFCKTEIKKKPCDKCAEEGKQIQCENNGFPDPKNCSKCVCPGGYGGKLCKDKPEGCGGIIDASREWQTITLETVNSDNNGKYNICTHWIKTNEDRTEIQVKLVSITGGRNDSVGCDNAGIEIKTNNDQRLTGYRFCSEEMDKNIHLESKLFFVPIITYSKDPTNMVFTLQYQAVPVNQNN